MSPQSEPGEFAALHAHAVEAWEALAGWWDETTGEADEFHQKLVIPATDRFRNLRPGERAAFSRCLFLRHIGYNTFALDPGGFLFSRACLQNRQFTSVGRLARNE